MFYETSTTEDSFLCKSCYQEYDEPRVLPCGHTICNKCISSMTNDQLTNRISCTLCSNVHQQPLDGFPINSKISQLMLDQPIEILRNEKCEQLKLLIREIQTKKQKFEFNILNNEQAIKEHSEELRTLVRFKTKQSILEINKLNKNLLKEIDDYEQEWLQNIKTKENIINYDDLKQQLNKLLNDSNDYLQQVMIIEDQTSELNDKLVDLKSQLEFEVKKFDQFLFGDKMVLFQDQQIDLGCLYQYRAIETDSLKKFSFQNLLNDKENIHFWGIVNGKICLGYKNIDSKLVIISFDKTDNNPPESKIICDCTYFDFARTVNKMVVIGLYDLKIISTIQILNESLENVATLDGSKYCVKGINEKNIFCFDKFSSNLLKVFSFNENRLEESAQFQMKNVNFQLVLQIDLHEDKFIILYKNILEIIDKNTGILLNSLMVMGDNGYFYIDIKEHHILLHKEQSNNYKLFCYDLNLKIKSETLIKCEGTLFCYSSMAKKNELTFFNKKLTELYFN